MCEVIGLFLVGYTTVSVLPLTDGEAASPLCTVASNTTKEFKLAIWRRVKMQLRMSLLRSSHSLCWEKCLELGVEPVVIDVKGWQTRH